MSSLNSACNCCQLPNSVVSVQFVSVQQSCDRTTCGFVPCSSESNPLPEESTVCEPNWDDLSPAEKCYAFYLTKVSTTHKSGEVSYDDGVLSYNYSNDFTTVTTENIFNGGDIVDGTCNYSGAETQCSGSSNASVSFIDTTTEEVYTTTCNSTKNEDCSWSGTLTRPFGDTETIDYPCDETINTDNTTTVVYSNKSTGKICYPPTLPDFPEFPINTVIDSYNDLLQQIYPVVIYDQNEPINPCSVPPPQLGQGYCQTEAYNYVNPHWETARSYQKLKFRVRHQPTASCYLKVWFRKKIQAWKFEDCDTGFAGDPPRTQPLEDYECETISGTGGICTSRWSTDGEPTYEDMDYYEWNGTGTPCFADPTKMFSSYENFINSDPVIVEVEMNKNESVTIEYKFSFIKNYEPNWADENGSQGCKPNGYPTAGCQ